ncbi:Na+/H+ antiporter subunit E [Nocardioides bruguierae]|uniref:Na+/H+ antiporter subunit E n=1 Tax=Nocardioides bruguierae TaxID=2945102 RepID=UPI002020900F|nr:Na+/H+ antiporter subunit E [Nocardioides bruguierae]MCL8027442.1 Na+/H+ antiporter subunit E [Nocardioides bruguierae]
MTALTLLRLLVVYTPWLIWQLLVSSVVLARDVMTPRSTQQPRIVRLDVAGLTDVEVALLTSSITITPGTLVLGIAPETEQGPRAAFVHGLFGEDEEALVRDLETMRDHVLAATRGRAAVTGRGAEA